MKKIKCVKCGKEFYGTSKGKIRFENHVYHKHGIKSVNYKGNNKHAEVVG